MSPCPLPLRNSIFDRKSRFFLDKTIDVKKLRTQICSKPNARKFMLRLTACLILFAYNKTQVAVAAMLTGWLLPSYPRMTSWPWLTVWDPHLLSATFVVTPDLRLVLLEKIVFRHFEINIWRNMFKRKLQALDYPSYGNFDVNKEKEFRAIVLWLEDQKIRHYKIEDREPMRQVTAVGWPAVFKQYQDDLGSAVTSNDPSEQLEWLLGYAVNLEYGDNVEKYKILKNELPIEKMNTPKLITANPLDNIDFSSDDFKAGVTSLAKLLNVTCHPDHLITLNAISKVVTRRLNPAALAAPDTVIVKGVPFPFLEADLGFDTGDYVLNQAAKILRLLYIHDMRDLQTKVNECIVSVQKVTADPKTDTKLGAVGR